MVIEKVKVAVGGLAAIHPLDAVAKETAVQTDEVTLGNFADEGGKVLVLHVGVGVELRSRGGVVGVAVVGKETEFGGRFAVLAVLVAVHNECLGGFEMVLGHQCHLHLVLNVLHTHAVAEHKMIDYSLKFVSLEILAYSCAGLDDGALDFVETEGLGAAIALGDDEVLGAHGKEEGKKKMEKRKGKFKEKSHNVREDTAPSSRHCGMKSKKTARPYSKSLPVQGHRLGFTAAKLQRFFISTNERSGYFSELYGKHFL